MEKEIFIKFSPETLKEIQKIAEHPDNTFKRKSSFQGIPFLPGKEKRVAVVDQAWNWAATQRFLSHFSLFSFITTDYFGRLCNGTFEYDEDHSLLYEYMKACIQPRSYTMRDFL